MNIEVFGYTLITTVLGMLVVFLSLTALSLLMVVLKALSREGGERPAGGGPGGERAAGRQRRGRRPTAEPGGPGGGLHAGAAPEQRTRQTRVQAPAADEREPPPWLAAAVVAYLAGEERTGPTAEPWFPEFNHFDPWVVAGTAIRRSAGRRAE